MHFKSPVEVLIVYLAYPIMTLHFNYIVLIMNKYVLVLLKHLFRSLCSGPRKVYIYCCKLNITLI